MKIAIDVQGLQTGSRFRGVGRYILGLVRGMIRNKTGHDIILTGNAALQESADEIRSIFGNILPKDNIQLWNGTVSLHPDHKKWEVNQQQALTSQMNLFSSIKPDVILASALLSEYLETFSFEIASLKKVCPVAIVLYDFLPYLHQEQYLSPKNSLSEKLYNKYFHMVKDANLLLGISEFTSKQAEILFPEKTITVIGCDVEPFFKKLTMLSSEKRRSLCVRLSIPKRFILYAGGLDERKNIVNLLEAFCRLPSKIRENFPLVIVRGKTARDIPEKYCTLKEISTLGYVSDEDLVLLYNLCDLFIFPSMEEGFGLPVLEAMRCGAPVIASNTTSIPEVAGMREALFDPQDVASIQEKILRALTDEEFRQQLCVNAARQSDKFSWDLSARLCLNALEHTAVQPTEKQKTEWIPDDTFPSVASMLRCDARKTLTVLFHTWPCAFDCPGGGEIQLLKYEEYLTKLGIRVLRYNPWHPQFDQVDIVHHFSSMGSTRSFCAYAKNVRGLPLVTSSIFWPDAKEKYDLGAIAELYRLSDLILPNSQVESEQLAALFQLPDSLFCPVVNGVDDIFFESVSPEMFRTHFGIEGTFVLCMGNIEPRKNQLGLIAALAGTGVQIVLAGQSRDREYAARCMAAGLGFVRNIGKLEHGSLLQRSAYAAADAFVLPSILETPGLAALEAAAAGTSLAVTEVGSTREYFGQYAHYLTPSDPASIRHAVLSALASPRPMNLPAFIRAKYTWPQAAQQLFEIYHKVINRKPPTENHVSPPVRQRKTTQVSSESISISFRQCRENKRQLTSDRYVHLSGEPTAVFSTPDMYLAPGSYTLVIRYSLWETVRPVHYSLITGTDMVANGCLKNGSNEILSLDFLIHPVPKLLNIIIDLPEGSTFIADSLSLKPQEKLSAMDAALISIPGCLRLSANEYDIDPNEFTRNLSTMNTSTAGTTICGPSFSLPAGAYRILIIYSSVDVAHCTLVLPAVRPRSGYILPAGNWHVSTLSIKADTAFPPNFLQIDSLPGFILHTIRLLKLSASPKPRSFHPTYRVPFTLTPDMLPLEGWHQPENDGIWTAATRSVFFLRDGSGDTRLELDLQPYLGNAGSRTILVKVNGHELIRESLRGSKSLSCFIPIDLADESGLLCVELKSEEPLVSPAECGQGTDTRKLGFKLLALRALPLPIVGEAGCVVSPFFPAMPDSDTGWHRPESNGTWTANDRSGFFLRSGEKDIRLELDLQPYLGKTDSKEICVKVNGHELLRESLCGAKTLGCLIPANLADEHGLLHVELESKSPLVSPAECGQGTDTRKLGFKLLTLRALPQHI